MARFAFLGAGRMAGAIVDGLLGKHAATPADLSCLSGTGATADSLAARTGIARALDLPDLCALADVVVIAFKPQQLASADPRLADLTRGKLVVSVLAGKRVARLAEVFPHARAIVRTMPNTPGQIGAGITGWCASQALSPADHALVDTLLGSLGQHLDIPEEQMDALTAVSGSGPAYLFEFAAALRDGGVAAGLSPEVAKQLTVETLLGAARLLARTAAEPEALRDQVTSPNGTTFAGLQCLAAHDLRGAVRDCVLAAQTRSRELSAG